MKESPQYNLKAEQAVLGSMIRDADARDIAMESMALSDFYEPRHQAVFKALVHLSFANQRIDLITLADCMEKRGELAKFGGSFYLTELVQSVTTSVNVAHHARIVKDYSVRREVLAVCEKTKSAIYGGQEMEEILSLHHRDIENAADTTGSGGFVHIQENINAVEDRIEKIQKGLKGGKKCMEGYSTGLVDLDTKISGLQPSKLYIIAARTSVGKSAMATTIIHHVQHEHPVALFSYEMSLSELQDRLVTLATGANFKEANSPEIEDRIKVVLKQVPGWNIWIDTTCPKLEQLEARARRWLSTQTNKKTIIIVDYLQLIPESTEKGSNNHQTRSTVVDGMVRSLKILSGKLQSPILLLSQVRRQFERNDFPKAPQLDDLRESGGIEQGADVVIILHRESEMPDDTKDFWPVICRIAKNRTGKTGIVYLDFQPSLVRFVCSAHQEAPPERKKHNKPKPQLWYEKNNEKDDEIVNVVQEVPQSKDHDAPLFEEMEPGALG